MTRGVLSVGLASFFSDAGHEITTSILPTFVTTTLRSSAGALGVIEGISDALIGVAKLAAGPLANDPHRRREIARGGYLVTAAATGAIGLAATVWQAGLLRAGAWVARGARSPARDALLASLVAPGAYGRAFGLERAGDNLGAVAGPLLAAVLVANLGIRRALYLAAVPGVFAAVAITAAAAQAAQRATGQVAVAGRRRLEVRAVLGSGLARPLVAIALFEFGNCATTLLILRSTGLLHHGGRSLVTATSLAIMLYAANNLLGAIVALGGGRWIDRVGLRVPFAGGALLGGLQAVGVSEPPSARARDRALAAWDAGGDQPPACLEELGRAGGTPARPERAAAAGSHGARQSDRSRAPGDRRRRPSPPPVRSLAHLTPR